MENTNNNNVIVEQAPAVTPQVQTTNQKDSLLMRLGTKWGVDWKELYNTLAKTCFKSKDGSAPTKEEMMSLLIIAEQAGLNPFLGEIYAFPGKTGGIVPIVGINGWRKIATGNPEYAGIRFEFSTEKIEVAGVKCCEYIKASVCRRRPDGTSYEAEGYAFFDEKFRGTDPWKQQPRQMLMNKAQIQALKNNFPSLSSLYDEEEGKDLAVSASAGPVVQSTAISWDRKDLDFKIQKVAQLAHTRNNWSLATEWVMKNTQGTDREYALERLSEARNACAEDAKVVVPTAQVPVSNLQVGQQDASLVDAPF